MLLGEGSRPPSSGDVVVLPEGAPHDLVNTGSEALEVIAYFSAPAVNQHWEDVVLPSNSHVTASPELP
ncbi:MAG TPA: hypothetical protein VF068_10460 [Rubrobacter sp.]